MARFGFILLLIAFPSALPAQAFMPKPDLRFENFNNQNHFISNDIVGIVTDKAGYVWTCSLGVQRFDGYKTIDFNSFNQSKSGLRDNYTDIIADHSGRVWVSSAGLCYYDDAKGKFIYISPGPKRNITYAYAFSVQKNSLWFVCDYGLARLDIQTLKISFTSLTNIENPLITFPIDENTLFISSREKIYIYNIKQNSYSVHTLIYKHSLLKIFAVAERGNDIFLATGNGLFRLIKLEGISLVSKEMEGVEIDDLLFLPGDSEKKYLLLATEGQGLLVYNTQQKKVEFTYTHDDSNPFSLPNNVISKLYADKVGRLWIATGLGISMVDAQNQQWKIRFLKNDNAGELRINKIVRDKYDSTKVWMSQFNQGVICMDWETKKISRTFNAIPGVDRIYDFAQLSKNRWLMVTRQKIVEWSPQAGVITEEKLPVPDSLRLVYNIHNIIMADSNTCYITTDKGLFKYDAVAHKTLPVSKPVRTAKKEDLLKYDLLNGYYDKGMLWIASRNGLFTYDIAKQVTRIYRGKGENLDYFFFDIDRVGADRVVCAADNGMAIFSRQKKSFTVIHQIANMLNPVCTGVTHINNTAYLNTDAGILTYDLATNISANAEYETQFVQAFSTSAFAVIGNDIAFGIRNGYAYFTRDPQKNPAPSDPVIERVYVNNQPVLQHFQSNASAPELVLGHSDNSININFTAFAYNHPDRINFRYKLLGADPRWQYAEDQRSANFAQLEPGDYVFYVQSGDKNGIWNMHLASISFTINHPYWETWWFRALLILAISFILYRLYLYRIKNLLAIQKIRERIASDFHDDIGSALSSISIFSEVADTQLEEKLPHEQTREIVSHISYYSRNMLDAMDDIIWAVNPKNDQFNDLAVRMREFAIPLLEARGIKFDITIDENMLNTRIKMEARKNIFLVFKECINNILKHSGCTAIKLSVDKLNNQLELIISDNGKGFDIHAPHSRNGLKNMQKRADEINGSLLVTTQQGKGTVTKLVVPFL